MSAYLSPIGNEQQSDANGAPVSGALINTYRAGTTTPVTTFSDAAGTVPQSNPIVCNSAGYPANPIYLNDGVAVKMVFTTSVTSGSVAYRPAVDNIQGVNDPAFTVAISEYQPFSGAPTFINATSFSVTGDQTNTFQVNRKLKSNNTGGTVYSQVVDAVFSITLTTVTVTNSAGVLDSGLSAVSFGLLAADNQSIPPVDQIVNAQTGTTYTYAKSDKGKLVTHSNAAAIAGTLPIASTTGARFWMDVQNRGAGTLTITPTTSTIDGSVTLVLTTGQGVRLVSDGTNYFTMRGSVADGSITAPKLSGAQTGSAPIFGVRAWVNFNGTGTVVIRGSGNVSSITDNGTGDYTVNFTTAMPNANYAITVSASSVASATFLNPGANFRDGGGTLQVPTTSSFRTCIVSPGGSAIDCDRVFMQVVG